MHTVMLHKDSRVPSYQPCIRHELSLSWSRDAMNKCKFSNNCFTGGTHHCNHFNNRFCHGGWRGETSGSGVMRHRINGAFYETLVLFHTIQIYTYIAFWTNGRKKMHKMKNIYIYIFRDNNLLLNLSKTKTLMVNNSFYSITSFLLR